MRAIFITSVFQYWVYAKSKQFYGKALLIFSLLSLHISFPALADHPVGFCEKKLRGENGYFRFSIHEL